MKKVYKKPSYVAEMFGFSQTIADTCYDVRGDSYANHWTKQTCAWLIYGESAVFIAGNDKCADHALEPNTQWGDFCYNAPDAGINVFAS